MIDTNGIVEKLEQRGFSRTQAEGITEALKELDVSTLSTKADLKDLELRLYTYLGGILIAHGPRHRRPCSNSSTEFVADSMPLAVPLGAS